MAGVSVNVTERMYATDDLAGVSARMLSGDHSFDDRRFATPTVFLLSEWRSSIWLITTRT